MSALPVRGPSRALPKPPSSLSSVHTNNNTDEYILGKANKTFDEESIDDGRKNNSHKQKAPSMIPNEWLISVSQHENSPHHRSKSANYQTENKIHHAFKAEGKQIPMILQPNHKPINHSPQKHFRHSSLAEYSQHNTPTNWSVLMMIDNPYDIEQYQHCQRSLEETADDANGRNGNDQNNSNQYMNHQNVSDDVSESEDIEAIALRRERKLLRALRDWDDKLMDKETDLDTFPEDGDDDDGDDDDHMLSVMIELVELYDDSCNLERKRDILQRLIPLTRKKLGANHMDVADQFLDLGLAQHHLNKDEDARHCVYKAIDIYESLPSNDRDTTIRLAGALTLLARVYSSLGSVVDQRYAAEKAVQVLETTQNKDDDYVADALSQCSEAYGRLGLHTHQRDACLRELRIRSANSDNNKSDEDINAADLVPVLRVLAFAYNGLGELEKEKSVLKQAYTIDKHYAIRTGNDSPRFIFTLTMLARTYAGLEEFESSLGTLEYVLRIKRERYGPLTSTVLETLWQLSGVCDDLCRYEDELVHLEQALIVSQQLYGNNDRRVAFVLSQLALCRVKTGNSNPEILETAYTDAFNILEAIYGMEHQHFAGVLKHFGEAFGMIGDLERQRSILRSALNTEQLVLPPDALETFATMAELGKCMGQLGYVQKQKELLESALQSLTDIPNAPLYRRMELMGELAGCYTELQEFTQARDTLLLLVQLDEQEYGKNSVIMGTTCKRLVDVYVTLGEIDNARVACERASSVLVGQLDERHRVMTELKWQRRTIEFTSTSSIDIDDSKDLT